MNRYLIVTGGTVSKRLLETVLSDYDFQKIIACDKGLEICKECNILPNLIIGDFDSAKIDVVAAYRGKTEFLDLDTHKDFTDTHVAISYILEQEIRPDEVILVGATGTRMDHTLANIGLLKQFAEAGISAYLIDEHNRITMTAHQHIVKRNDAYRYVSLLPYTEQVTGVTLQGFYYNAQGLTLKLGESIGVSNELIAECGLIEFESGLLIVIESRD